MKLQDLTGRRFGRLVVKERAPSVNKRTMWKCQCDCGNTVICEAYTLKIGESKSCGCWKRESQSERARTHGMTHHPLYQKYMSMIHRCESKNSKSYKDYGGRGIKVCSEWRNDFMKFYNWCIDNGYREGLTIDRIDNNGDYSPENCRWATKAEQDNNRRSNHFITYNGETHTIAEWSRICGINRGTLWNRINRGMDAETALTKPLRRWK